MYRDLYDLSRVPNFYEIDPWGRFLVQFLFSDIHRDSSIKCCCLPTSNFFARICSANVGEGRRAKPLNFTIEKSTPGLNQSCLYLGGLLCSLLGHLLCLHSMEGSFVHGRQSLRSHQRRRIEGHVFLFPVV